MKLISLGTLIILAVLAVFTAIYWYYMLIGGEEAGFDIARVSFFVGSLSILTMAGSFALATRLRLIESAFGGLDKMYVVHKYLGIAAVLLLIAHFFSLPANLGGDDYEDFEQGTVAAQIITDDGAGPSEAPDDIGGDEDFDDDDPPYEFLVVPTGIAAACGFMLLVTLTLNRKVPYHTWYQTHRLMGVFFIVAGAHTVFVLLEGNVMSTTSAPSLYLFAAVGVGLTGYIYKEFFYKATRYRFTVETVNRFTRAVELVLKPMDKGFAHRPGQFAFVTIEADGLRETHPFTISSAPDEANLRFTVKALGDYSRRLITHAVEGMSAVVSGPYGRFDPLTGSSRQVWIAGGVGITPFLSVTRALDTDDGREIHLFYCIRSESDGLFLDELRKRARTIPGLHLYVFESDLDQRLSLNEIEATVGGKLAGMDHFLCGPSSLVTAMRDGLRAKGVAGHNVHSEHFEIR